MPEDIGIELPEDRRAVLLSEPLYFPEPESEPILLLSEPETQPPFLIPEGETEPLTLPPETPEEQFVDSNQILQMPAFEGAETFPEITPPDNTTVVTYTVKLYYTQEVEDDTADLQGFFDQVIAETNQGYANSDIPLKNQILCSEKIALAESGSAETDLAAFLAMGASTVRDTADTAALITL